MPNRRILSIWFPRLAAERVLRRLRPVEPVPLAVVAEVGGARRLAALSAEAEAAGLFRDQPLGDARAICPGLVTRPADPLAEAAFLAALRRWAERYAPLVAEEPPEALLVDITGCAHLFGGEAAMLEAIARDCADMGLSHTAAIADTAGAAWALARFGAAAGPRTHAGDAIRQEARATRARAAPRRPVPAALPVAAPASGRIALPGGTRAALAPLPVAALRLAPETAAELARLGLRRIGDLAGLPRAALARRFGLATMRRLDQALGLEPEPLSPARAAPSFSVRLSLPEPVGRTDDILAALDRMLPRLAARLEERGQGARRLRLQAFRADGGVATVEVGLARPGTDPARIRPLLEMKLAGIDAGFGIDVLRLEAVATEPVHAVQHRGHLDASAAALARQQANGPAAPADAALRRDDLLGRIGARVGLEAITRLHPGDSHIPEKAVQTHAAAWSAPAGHWPAPPVPRPLVLLRRPEIVTADGNGPGLPEGFRWRRRLFRRTGAAGPERIAPEWWLDDPAWRSGSRDYWRVETDTGLRLWLFHAHGGEIAGGWFCHGLFA